MYVDIVSLTKAFSASNTWLSQGVWSERNALQDSIAIVHANRGLQPYGRKQPTQQRPDDYSSALAPSFTSHMLQLLRTHENQKASVVLYGLSKENIALLQ